MQILATVCACPHINSVDRERLNANNPKNEKVSELQFRGNLLHAIKLQNGTLFVVNDNCWIKLTVNQ